MVWKQFLALEVFHMAEGRMEVPYIERFAQIPQWWLENYAQRATDLQFRVYVVARSYAYGDKQSAWPSNGTLADQCGCTKRAIRMSINYWENVGVLKREPRYDKNKSKSSNRIVFIIPNDVRTDDQIGNTDSGGSGNQIPEGEEVRFPLNRQEEPHNENQTRQDNSGRVGSGFLGEIVKQYEQAVKRQAYTSERAFLDKLLDRWGKEDVEYAICEFMVRKLDENIKSPARYIEGVITNNAQEGGKIPYGR
jgi:hypothetical protein